MKKIYLAGPDVFRADVDEVGYALKYSCKAYEFKGLFPLDNKVNLEDLDATYKIYTGNFEMIKECDIILANIERFRGPSCDVGTAWEIGAAKALGKIIVLYNCDFKEYKDVAISCGKFPLVEDFMLPDNLMIIESADEIFPNIISALRWLHKENS